MTDLLLDTHALYWYEAGDTRLGTGALQAMQVGSRALVVSTATILEMATALDRGRWPQVAPFFPHAADRLRIEGYRLVAIEARHAEASVQLQRIHNDPFNRLLIATAQLEGLILVTGDAIIHQYGVPCLW